MQWQLRRPRMIKKLFMMTALMALALSACGGQDATETVPPAATDVQVATETAAISETAAVTETLTTPEELLRQTRLPRYQLLPPLSARLYRPTHPIAPTALPLLPM